MSENKPDKNRASANLGKAGAAKPAPAESKRDKDPSEKARAAGGQTKVEKTWFQRLLGMEPEGLRAELERLSADTAQTRADYERAALEAESAVAALKKEQQRTNELSQSLASARARESASQERVRECEREAKAAQAREAGLTAQCDRAKAAVVEREQALSTTRTQLEQARAAAAQSADSETKARSELQQVQTKLAKVEQAHAALERARSGDRNALQTRKAEVDAREAELKKHKHELGELTRTCAQLEAEKVSWTATQRKLLDEHDGLSAQLDELRSELAQQREAHKSALTQWLAVSLSFWRALERTLGQRAPLAISFSAQGVDLGASRATPLSTASELDQFFSSIGVEVKSSLNDASVDTGVELRLRGAAVSERVIPEPLWFAGVALPHLERALGQRLSVDDALRSSDDEVLLRLSGRSPSA